MRKLSLGSMVGIASLFVGSTTGLAEDSSYRAAVREKSARQGVGFSEIAVLRRAAPPGQDAVMEAVVDEFERDVASVRTGSIEEITSSERRNLVKGDGWFLEVRGKGNWIRYRDVEYVESAENVPMGLDSRPRLGQLQGKALSFIRSRLASLVPLGPGEKLEPWYVAHSINISGEGHQEPVREVIASKIVFTRVVDGLPVLGSGSKVVIYIASEGTIYGFDINWAALERTGQKRTLVDLDVVRVRAEVVRAAKRADVANEAETSLECGYFDAGARDAPETGELQAACVAMYKSIPGSRTRHSRMDVIPASSAVIEDESVPETILFSDQ